MSTRPKQSDTTEPKYPHVKVKLVGHDGNAFTVLGRVTQAMRRHGLGDAASGGACERAK
jgi:hypothetical protein